MDHPKSQMVLETVNICVFFFACNSLACVWTSTVLNWLAYFIPVFVRTDQTYAKAICGCYCYFGRLLFQAHAIYLFILYIIYK